MRGILRGRAILSSIDSGDAVVSSCLRCVFTRADRIECRFESRKLFLPAVQALSEPDCRNRIEMLCYRLASGPPETRGPEKSHHA